MLFGMRADIFELVLFKLGTMIETPRLKIFILV